MNMVKSKENPTVLVTGASGLLGRAMMRIVKGRGWKAVGLAFTRTKDDLVKCNLTNPSELEEVFTKYKPDYIIHTAVERRHDKVENHYEETRKINVNATRTIASVAKKLGSRLIYISTDYVFDGTNPPYTADMKTGPLNKYGVTKLDGEKAIQEEYKEGTCILRIPIMYGPVEHVKECAVTSLLSLLTSSKPAGISHYERRYPAHVNDISNICCDLVIAMIRDPSVCGVFQWCGREMLTKYDMIQHMSKALSLDYSHISPETEARPGAATPYDCELDISRLKSMNIHHHTSFKDAIKDILLPWK